MKKHYSVLLDPTPSDATGASPAASSTATPDATAATAASASSPEKTLADVVQDTLDKHKETQVPENTDTTVKEEGDATPPVDKEEPNPEGDVANEPPADTEELPPFHEHPRWKEVTAKAKTLEEENAKLKPQAEIASTLQTYCQQQNLSDVDLRQALEFAALSKNNPTEFWKKITELKDSYEIIQGTKLPTDLQKEVDDGTLSETRAKELAQLRIAQQQKDGQLKSVEQQQIERTQSEITSALNRWEADQKKADPDYANRWELIQDRFLVLAQANPPRTAQEAIVLAERANKEVKERTAKFRPQAQPRKHLSTNGSSTTKNVPVMNDWNDFEQMAHRLAAKH